jgi:hypothetical protein
LASVQQQTAVERIQQIVLVDHVGVGIGGMYASLPTYAPAVRGEYVHILCDDDVLADVDVVETVEAFAKYTAHPEVMLVAARKGESIWPAGEPWPPQMGRIDLGCAIVRSDVWNAHVADYGRRYEGDYDFLAALAHAGRRAVWCDLLFSVGAVSRGAAEAA